MELRCENVDKFTVHSLLVNIIGDELADIILARAGRAMQRENQGLLWVFIAHKAVHGLQDDAGCDVLSEQPAVQVGLQTWRVQNRESSVEEGPPSHDGKKWHSEDHWNV